MTTARIFKKGKFQAVQLPKEFRFNTSRVEILRRGNEVVLRDITGSALRIFDALCDFPANFMSAGREGAIPQERESF